MDYIVFTAYTLCGCNIFGTVKYNGMKWSVIVQNTTALHSAGYCTTLACRSNEKVRPEVRD